MQLLYHAVGRELLLFASLPCTSRQRSASEGLISQPATFRGGRACLRRGPSARSPGCVPPGGTKTHWIPQSERQRRSLPSNLRMKALAMHSQFLINLHPAWLALRRARPGCPQSWHTRAHLGGVGGFVDRLVPDEEVQVVHAPQHFPLRLVHRLRRLSDGDTLKKKAQRFPSRPTYI